MSGKAGTDQKSRFSPLITAAGSLLWLAAQPSSAPPSLAFLIFPPPRPPCKTSLSSAEEPTGDVQAGLGEGEEGSWRGVPPCWRGADVRPPVVVSWWALEEDEDSSPCLPGLLPGSGGSLWVPEQLFCVQQGLYRHSRAIDLSGARSGSACLS